MAAISEPDLLRRQRATEATMAKYRGKAFDWKAGVTCVHLARFHLRQMGHRPEPLPRVRSLIAAKRALAQRGWSDTPDMLDALPGLMRIAPAQLLLGDLAVAPGEEGMSGILVCAGPQKLIGWREDTDGMAVLAIRLDELLGAWRV